MTCCTFKNITKIVEGKGLDYLLYHHSVGKKEQAHLEYNIMNYL